MAFKLYNTFQLCSPKNPFLISHGYSASFTAGLWSHLCPFSLICRYKESCFFFSFFPCHGSSHTKTHLACEKGKRGRPADLFVINWHTATIDYWTWQCLFQRNLSAVTSLALLQQGQRTQRETNQYHIECKSGRSLIWGDERRETKKEDLGTEKGERESEAVKAKEREKLITKRQNRIRGMTGEARGWKSTEIHSARDCETWMKDWKRWKWRIVRTALKVARNLVGGSNISLQRCHRHKHTNGHLWMNVESKTWSTWGEYFPATDTNTYLPWGGVW